jgi:diguanylate cyclase (GGDEF)-like protein
MDHRRRLLLGLACVPLAIGALVLVGWVLDVRVLVAVIPGQVTMKPNTAVCFILSAVALAVTAAAFPRAAVVRVACVTLVVLLAGATLLEYVCGTRLGIDELLFREPVLSSGSSHPGRMAPNTAVNFVLLGLSFLVAPRRSRNAARVAQALTFVAMFVTLVATLGYAYQARVLVGLFSLNRMAVHTIVAFAALGAGVLVATAERAWIGELLRSRSSRAVASRLLPAALVVPICIGAAVLAGFRAGLYDAAFAACLMAGAEVISFTLLTWLSVRALNAFEEEKAVSRIDVLTGLRARRGFLIEATDMLAACHSARKSSLVLFVDLDGMKQVNDALGHEVGDAALVEMASVLRSVFRSTDVIARLGGDEFVIFCGAGTAAFGAAMVKRLTAKLDEINAVPGRRYRLACSAGFKVADVGTEPSLDELLSGADAAMYAVKRSKPRIRSAVTGAAQAVQAA